MSDFDRLQNAFIEADKRAKQGDEKARADAAMFAQEINRLRSAQTAEAAGDSDGVLNVMSFVNKAIAEGAGGLVDVINPFDKYTGSAETGLKDLMKLGNVAVAQREPESFVENLAYGTGSAAASIVPVAKVGQMFQQAPNMLGRFAQTVAPQLATRGGAAAELVSGGLASGASGEAERQGYDETGQLIAGFAGGISPGFVAPAMRAAGRAVLATPVVGTGISAAAGAVAPFTKVGARRLAGQRVRELAGGDQRASKLAESISPTDGYIDLSPAEMTGEPNLIRLQRAAALKDPTVADKISRRQFKADVAAREGIQSDGRVEDAQAFIAQRQADFSNTLDNYVAAARASAQQKTPKASMDQIDSSKIVATELRRAEKLAKSTQKMLWEKIPKEFEIDVSGVRSTIESLIEDATRIDKDNIPPEAFNFLKATRETGSDSIKEVYSLYSEMRDTARNATAGENVSNSKARIANIVADSILNSLENIRPDTGINRSIIEARIFSREMHDKFSRGKVGDLLKRTSRGGDKIPQSLTLQRSIDSGGDVGFVAQQDIAAATRDLPGKGETDDAIANYLRNTFTKTVFSGDKFSETKAVDFLNNNQRMLNEFPAVRSEIEQSIASRSRLSNVTSRASDLSQSIKTSTPAVFSAAIPDRALNAVITAQNPRKAMANLIATAKKDKTGASLAGLKAAVSRDLLSSAIKPLDVVTQAGARSEVRGARLTESLENEVLGGVAQQVFSKGEMSRLRIISKELEKLDQARVMSSTGETMSMFKPNALVSVAARILAARNSAGFGGGMGGSMQAAQIASGRAQRILEKLTNSKAQQLLIDAVQDPQLMRDLLLNVNLPKNLSKLEKTLAPYIVGSAVGSEPVGSEAAE